MKKFFACLLSFLLIVGIFANFIPKYETTAYGYNSFEYSIYRNEILNEFSHFKNREPGSEGERLTAEFIKDKLDNMTQEMSNLSAVNSSAVVDGIQTFYFNSIFDGLKKESQNLIYFYKSTNDTDKKVILACNYDAVAFDFEDLVNLFTESESINGSAGSVAVLLSLVKLLPTLNLPFNVEIVFFGAGESENAGSNYYTKGILPEIRENILALINIDNIAVGKNLYYYIDEVQTSFSSYIETVLSDSNIKKVDTVHLGKIMTDYPNELGLNYSHIAMNSDNINFMANNILSINLFAGDYDSGIIYGKNEYLQDETITYTKNDNIAYISDKYGATAVSNNLTICFDSIVSMLTSENFENECLKAQNQTTLFYKIFGNQKFIAYLAVVVLIIIIAVISYFNLRLSIKSYESKLEPEFLSTVISITEHIDKECKDENVPKVISKVIANDIKKDKTIKTKKKKD